MFYLPNKLLQMANPIFALELVMGSYSACADNTAIHIYNARENLALLLLLPSPRGKDSPPRVENISITMSKYELRKSFSINNLPIVLHTLFDLTKWYGGNLRRVYGPVNFSIHLPRVFN